MHQLRTCRHLSVALAFAVRLEALLRTIGVPRAPIAHGPPLSAPKRCAISDASTPGTASPMPYTVPAPRPGPSAAIRYVPSSSGSPVAYHNLPQHAVPPPGPVSAPLTVTIPSTMPYRQHVTSPAQMSPFTEPNSAAMRRPTSLSRTSSSGSISTMSPRPLSALSNAMPRVVSASVPPAAASSSASTASTSATAVFTPVKRKPKAKRVLTEDFLMDDVKWFR